jgi:hypothetical protein
MQNLQNAWIEQDMPERVQRAKPDGIDEGNLIAHANLQKTKNREIGPLTDEFGVQSQNATRLD